MAKKHKRATRQKSKKAYKVKLKPQTVLSIAQIMFLSLAALVMVSFARQGLILVQINDFLISLFSWTTIFIPFIFVSFSFLVSKYRFFLSQPNVVVGMILFFFSVTVLSQAGIVGKSAWEGMASLITVAGAFIVLLGTTVVGLIILFNTSLDQVFAFLVDNFRRYGIRGTGVSAQKGKFAAMTTSGMKDIV